MPHLHFSSTRTLKKRIRARFASVTGVQSASPRPALPYTVYVRGDSDPERSGVHVTRAAPSASSEMRAVKRLDASAGSRPATYDSQSATPFAPTAFAAAS